MPELIIQSAKLIPHPKRGKNAPGFATSYIYEPEPTDASGLGALIAVIEVVASKDAEEVCDLIIRTAGEAYYNSEGTSSPAERFEVALKQVNHELSGYIEQGQAAWIGKLSAIVAVVSSNQLFLAQAGSAEAYLYRDRREVHISHTPNPRIGDPLKTFSEVISGELVVGDKLLFATPALIHHFAQEELLTVICDSTSSNAVAKLGELIDQEDYSDRVAALIINLTSVEAAALSAREVVSEDTTIGAPKSIPAAISANTAPILKSFILQAGYKVGQILLAISKRLSIILGRIGLMLARFIRNYLRSKRNRRQKIIMFVVVTATLIWGIYFATTALALAKLEGSYDTALAKSANASQQLSNGDKSAAKSTFQEAVSQLEPIQESKYRDKLASRLNKRTHPQTDPGSVEGLLAHIHGQIDILEGITRPGISELAELSSLGSNQIRYLEQSGSNLIMVDQDGSIHHFDLVATQLKTTVSRPQDTGKVLAVTSSSAGIYLLTDQPGVWQYSPDSQALNKKSVSFGDWPVALAISAYGGNLYLLPTDNSQIYKHIPTAGGFSAKSNYLSSDQINAIKGSSGLAVDGSVYTANGRTLLRFLNGKQIQQLQLPEAFSRPLSLKVSSDNQFLIITDAETQRIGQVKIDANSMTLLKQYQLPGQGPVWSVAWDSKSKQYYTLFGSKLIKFNP